jgi:hypothetical protein
VHGLHAATSKVVNSAQGSSCKLKFVHGTTFGGNSLFNDNFDNRVLYATEKRGERAEQGRDREGERWSVAVKGLQRGQ